MNFSRISESGPGSGRGGAVNINLCKHKSDNVLKAKFPRSHTQIFEFSREFSKVL
jgi:hypothetical protein